MIAATRDKPLVAAVIMPDNVCGSSRSRNKRRSRSHRKKAKKCTAVSPHTPPEAELKTNNKDSDETNNETKVNELSASATTPAVTGIHNATEHNVIEHEIDSNERIESKINNKSSTENITEHQIYDITKNNQSATVNTINNATESIVEEQSVSEYKVEFPIAGPIKKKTTNNNMTKSRSLDDDEKVKITELSDEETGTVVSVSESTAIVSEADSDVEWEVVADLAMKKQNSGQQFGKMSVISLPLEECVTYETSHVSPEDERSLRDFLEGLDLVSSPEESVKRIEKPSTTEAVKMKRAKNRAALAQHFLPYFENPRYLDVISEEGSDLSDRDSKQQSTSYRCRIVDNIDDNDDDVFEDIQTKLQNKFQTYYAGVNDGAILVGTKLIDHRNTAAPVKEATWSTSMTETASGAEVVYLDDSSESMTPSDLLDLEDNTADLDADDEEDISVDLEKSCSDSLDIELAAAENFSLIKSDNIVTSSSSTTSRDSHLTHNEEIKSESPHKISPPIPNTFTNDSVEESSKPVNIKTIDFGQTTFSENNESADDAVFAKVNDWQNTQEDIKSTSNQNKIIDNEIKDYEKVSESEEELNKELKNMFERWDKPEQEYKISEIDAAANTSPSRSNSASSVRSSRSTSQCTAVYNPLHSSLTNIAAALRESTEDEPGEEPAPLREICVRTLLALPFGKDIIEELANVSLGIEEMTCRTPSHLQSNQNQSQILPTYSETELKHKSSPTTHCDKSDTDNNSVLLADNPIVRDTSLAMEKERHREHEHWIGMPTEENPNLLVCLSPSQKEFIDKTKSFPNEADSLLDLHRKYIERRGYHEDYEHVPLLTTNKDTPQIPSFKMKFESIDNNNDCRINYHDYIKKFTHEIPIQIIKSDNSNHGHAKNGNLRYDKYIKQVTREVPIQVEKQINKPVNNKIYSAALLDEINEKTASTSSNQRLRAQHLGEWLNLARNESDRINILNEHTRKVYNLHSSVNKLVSQRSCEDRSPNSMEPQFTRDASARRYSLPFILYEQQMEYILEKEREIEQEIEKLKHEKSKLENNHSSYPTLNPSLILTNINQPPKQFNAANYQISRKGDIAILNSETPKLSPKNNATNMATEKFRQEMYNEYLCKIAERQERKHNKVLKIQISLKNKSDETDQSSGMSPQYEVKHVCGIEDEFMNKVREKKSKLGVDETEDDDDKTLEVASSDLPPVKIMDGSSVKETSQLPKHLQEFVDYTASASTTDDGEFYVVKIAMSVVWFFVMNFYYFLWKTIRYILKF